MKTPTSSDTLSILLKHDEWATRRLLEFCRSLTPEQFHQPFPIGPAEAGGLHDVITHILGATGRWTDRVAGRPVRTPIYLPPPGFPQQNDYRKRTPDELLLIHDQTARDLAGVVAAIGTSGLADVLSLEFTTPKGTERYQFTKAAALAHIATHAVHHRTQCLHILRRLGLPAVYDNPGDLSVCDWQHETECQA